MKSGFLQKLLDRTDKIDKEQIVDYMLEIAEERDMLFHLFDSMIEGMVVIDEDETVIYINHSARNILDMGDGPSIPDLPLEKFLFYPSLVSLFRDGMESSESIHFENYTLVIAGEKKFLQLNIIPLSKSESRFGTMLLFLDQTHQKEQEKRLREAEKLAALTTLSAGVSHEIRNPLNALSIHLQLLKRHLRKKGMEDEEVKDVLTIFSNEINRLNNVIESFLTAARPSTPKLMLVNLYNLITEILNLMEPEFLLNKIHVSLHEQGNWPLIKADYNQLKQAFINVLRNAVEAICTQTEEEAADKSKAVIIHQIRSENEVTIAIEDSGKGIPEEDLNHIFEPYFTSKPKGTGLGLMVVDRIIREHNGKVSATSQEGIGTQISITFPVAAESPKLLEQGINETNESK